MFVERHITRDCLRSVEDAMRHALGSGRIAEFACRHLDTGGARVRARLGLDAAESLGLTRGTAVAIAATAELLHNAALVHDDLQDHDVERRGQPALWSIAGADAAICAGDLMISSAYAALATPAVAAAGAPMAQAISLVHGAVAETVHGQSQDLTDGIDAPFERAIAIASAKSGPLLALPIRLALLMAQTTGDALARKSALSLAVGYQIADDLVDLPLDRAAGRLNSVTALERAGLPTAHARAAAIEHARLHLRTAIDDARAIPQGAGTPLADLSARVQFSLTEIANAP